MAVIHETPGLIPIEAFTITGLSVKPNTSNPIGKFGTGLKYAIAVLVRMDIKVTVFIGQVEYVFYKTKKKFRGHDYDAIKMKKRKGLLSSWSYHELPFTTEYGKFWELWQVFRELHSNTLDEEGKTYLTASELTPGLVSGVSNGGEHTLFVIEDSRYDSIFRARDEIFLPKEEPRWKTEQLEIYDRPSKYLYFRGLRVMDLKKPARFTYNFIEDLDLTEDRTLKYPSLVGGLLVGYMQEHGDDAFLQKAMGAGAEAHYEGSLNHGEGYSSSWNWVSSVPSATYLTLAKASSNPTARQKYEEMQMEAPTMTIVKLHIPRPSLSLAEKETLEALADSFIQGTEVIYSSPYGS